MENWSILDENWRILTELLPPGWQEQAGVCGAVERVRRFVSEDSLLRTLLLHIARGYSLRETVVRARNAGIAAVSDVALLKRVRKSEQWLKCLCLSLLRDSGVVVPDSGGINLRVVDATVVKEPGKTGSQWRIHYSLQIPSLSCDFFEITSNKGVGAGESFKKFPVQSGDFIIGDRGYSSAAGLEHLIEGGAHVLVRVNTGSLLLFSAPGQPFALRDHLRGLRQAGTPREWEVMVRGQHGFLPGRLCAIRKSAYCSKRSQRKMLQQAQKKGKTVKKETLEYARYVLVFTTFPKEKFTTSEVLEWYRLRWQIELLFKRLKSLAQLGHLPKHDPKSSRAWLYGKLLVALLSQKLVRIGREISPWGYLLEKPTVSQSMA
jgi:hypothetical protein